MLRSKCCAPVLLAFLVTACAPAAEEDQAAGTPDTMTAAGESAELAASDRAAIEGASDRWVAAAQAGNWEEVGSLYSENAVLMAPNAETVEGRAGVLEGLNAFPPIESIRFDQVHIDGCGDLAYVHGEYTMTFALPDDQTMEDRGKYIEIWERQDDGQWRITRDIFNSDLPAPGSAQ
jgi:uncharacterized protein (TIGR02246 family)